MAIMGFHRDGGFAEPLSCCLNALELGRVAPGKSVGTGAEPQVPFSKGRQKPRVHASK